MKVVNCARCGDSHDDVIVRAFAIPFAPPEARGIVWSHWATCPTSGDPILIAIVEEDDGLDGPVSPAEAAGALDGGGLPDGGKHSAAES